MSHTRMIGILGFMFASAGSPAADLTDVQANNCINQIKMTFRDPDSARLVQVMGSRGMGESSLGGSTWIRYKGTNAYGGYVSKSMLCHPTRPAVFAKLAEETCIATVAGLLSQAPNAYSDLPVRSGESRDQYINRASSAITQRAADYVTGGINDLPMCR